MTKYFLNLNQNLVYNLRKNIFYLYKFNLIYVKVWPNIFMLLRQELRNQNLLHIQDLTLFKSKGARIITSL